MLQENTYSKKVTLLEILIGIRIILSFVPAAAEYSPFIINMILVVAIWLLLFSSDSSYMGRKMLQFCPLYLIAFVNLLWGYKSTTLPLFVYGMMQWFIFPVAVSYLIDTDQKYAIKRLLVLSTLCVVITCVTTYIGNETIPGASRALAAIWNEDAEQAHLLRRMNIGGFEFAYLLTLLMPLLVYVFKQRIGKLLSALIILLGVVFIIAVIKTEYTTALIFSILGLMTILLPKNFSTKQMVVYCIIGGISAFLFTEVLISVLGHFAENTESGVIAERLNGISDILSGNQTEGDTESRQELMSMSWQSFINNPLTGSDKVGGHSYILDTMGHWGVLGILFLVIVLGSLYKLFIKPYNESPIFGVLLFIYIAQFGLCILNTTIIESFFFIFVPTLAYLTRECDDAIEA